MCPMHIDMAFIFGPYATKEARIIFATDLSVKVKYVWVAQDSKTDVNYNIVQIKKTYKTKHNTYTLNT